MLRTPSRPVAPRVPLTLNKQPTHINSDIERYREYLVKHVTRSPDTRSEQEYAHRANAIHQYRGKQVRTFAPFHPDRSAVRTWTPAQITLCSVLVALVVIGLVVLGISTLTVLFAVVTLLYVALLGLSVAWIAGTSKPVPSVPFDEATIEALKRAPWPTYTILCPLYRERAIVPQFVEAMRALDYPADCLQVLFLTESDDDETRRAILSLRLPDHFHVLTVPPGTPRTKPRACNYGLLHATGEYVVIYDAEDVPDPLQLKKAVLTFASVAPEVACVQAKLNYYNPTQNLLTRWFTVEYSLWFDLILPGLQRIGFALPLGGTSNHFRASMLRALGAWDAFNVTEDCDLGLKLAEQGLQTVVMDSTTYEEANSRPFSWVKQRSRWIKGYMQTYLVHTRHPLKTLKRGKIKDALSLHLFVGTGSMILLVNPIMWAMFAVYLVCRPVALYHQLFPWPVLYAGMGCFLLGNFLPIYASMVGCVKREHYSLVKWCLFLPLYWVLASIAAFLAGYELLVKPHYWHKTQHGLHLNGKGDTSKVAAVKAQTMHQGVTSSAVTMAGVTASVRAMPTVLLPALRVGKFKRKPLDRWVCVVVVVASICSIASTVYYFIHNDILLYGDAYFHLRIGRRIFDSATPGVGQLGTTWLPLPHFLMMPFAQNDYLWRTGLAGSFPSMACYVVAAVYLFLSAKRLTGKSLISFCGTLLFLSNPNILYLQSTPLTELLCIATLTAACYYFLLWIYDGALWQLIISAGCVFLTTTARYDGWALFGILAVLVPIICLMKRYRLKKIEGTACIYLVLGSVGILLWLAYNTVFMGNPLYFEQGPYSSKAQTLEGNSQSVLYAYHNAWEAIRLYAADVMQTVGPAIFLLSLVAIALFMVRKRFTPEFFGVLAYLAPFAFYVLSLYTGDVALLVPGMEPAGTSTYHQLFNDRFGSEMVVPISIFLVVLVARFCDIARRFLRSQKLNRYLAGVVSIGFALIILAQSYSVAHAGIISLEDGQYGVSCEPTHTINIYLAQHYAGGRILEELFSYPVDGTEANFDFKNIIWEGSYQLWDQALANPYAHVEWIVMNPNNRLDVVAHHVNVNSVQFRSRFRLVMVEPTGLSLYLKKGVAVAPSRPIPSYVANDLYLQHQLCDNAVYPK